MSFPKHQLTSTPKAIPIKIWKDSEENSFLIILIINFLDKFLWTAQADKVFSHAIDIRIIAIQEELLNGLQGVKILSDFLEGFI